MKKVLIVTGGGVGGAERMSVFIYKLLLKQGYDCHLVVITSACRNPDLLSFIPEKAEVTVIISRFRKHLFHLKRIIRKEKPDIVFASMPFLICLLVLLKLIFLFNPYKLIARQYTMPSKMKRSMFYITKLSFHFTNIVIAQTEEMREEIIRLFNIKPQKVVTIYNPIDKELIDEKLKEIYKMDSSFINFVAVGRISISKDYETMLRAFKVFKDKHKNVRLYIIGNISKNEYCNHIVTLSKELGIKDSVFFEGLQDNPFKYVAASDAFLLSSKVEGLPNALLEALYIGTPVVATKCIPFIPQVVKEGQYGYTVPVGDYEEMARAMEKALIIKTNFKETNITNSPSIILHLFSNI